MATRSGSVLFLQVCVRSSGRAKVPGAKRQKVLLMKASFFSVAVAAPHASRLMLLAGIGPERSLWKRMDGFLSL